jgi:hypothetical protein
VTIKVEAGAVVEAVPAPLTTTSDEAAAALAAAALEASAASAESRRTPLRATES